jgi:hypothetical protein
VRSERDEQVSGHQRPMAGSGLHSGNGRDVRLDCLGLVSGHQRPAAGVSEQIDPLNARRLAQPADADVDLGQRMVEQEVGLVSAETRVPPEKAVAALGQQAGEVVLGEVDVVVRRDEGRRRPGAGRAMVEALARMAAPARPTTGDGKPGSSSPPGWPAAVGRHGLYTPSGTTMFHKVARRSAATRGGLMSA